MLEVVLVSSRRGRPAIGCLALLAPWLLWSLASTARSDWGWAPALPYLLCPIVLVVGVAVGRSLSSVAGSVWVRLVLVLASVVLILGVVLVDKPGKAPLGYPNANAALAVQVLALCGLALLATPRPHRRPLIVAALLCVISVALNRSAAGSAVTVPVAAAVALVTWLRPRGASWGKLVAITGAACIGTAAVVITRAANARPFPSWADRAFDPVREQLWHDAVTLWRAHPIAGSGPGSFANASALSADPDTLAAHSSVLQVGAEVGAVGVALLGLIIVAGLLWTVRGAPAAAIIGASSWSALVIHSTVDHLIEFGWVVLVAGVVIGLAGTTRWSEQLHIPQGERPVAGRRG